MVARVEQVARYFREKGTPESDTLAGLLEDVVSYGRSWGADEEIQQKVFTPYQLQTLLAKAFTSEDIDFTKEALPLALADRINTTVQQLPDEFPLEGLHLKKSFIPPELRTHIPDRAKGNYHAALYALRGNGRMKTIGEVRRLTYKDLEAIRNLGQARAPFIHMALRKVESTQPNS